MSKHGRVLLSVAQDPRMRLRDIAAAVGLTERRVHAILTDLIDSGYVVKDKDGRRNHYAINGEKPVPDISFPLQRIGEVVHLLTSDAEAPVGRSTPGAGR